MLLAILTGVAAYGVPRIAGYVSGTPSSLGATGGSACRVPPGESPLLKWSLAQLDTAVATRGLRSLMDGGTADIQGLQEPTAAWSDGDPADVHSPDPSITPADAGFELRWWSRRRDHQAADLFVFPSPDDAARYVSQAASPRCRNGAASYAISQPARGRALVWTNPEGYLQADVFFSRANRAYRIVEVPPARSGLDHMAWAARCRGCLPG